MDYITREYINALLDVERIAHSVVHHHLGAHAWTSDLVDSITGAYVRRQRAEAMYEIIAHVTNHIPLIPRLREV